MTFVLAGCQPKVSVVTVQYDGISVSVDNPFEKKGVSVDVEGADVSVNASCAEEIIYLLKGTSSDGSFRLCSASRQKLYLKGLQLKNSDGPAINIQSRKKTTVFLAKGTTNVLEDGEVYAPAEEDRKAAFFSEGQLAFRGKGELVVGSVSHHSLCSDDYIRIEDGHISVNHKAVGKDGIVAKDAFEMSGGELSVVSDADGDTVAVDGKLKAFSSDCIHSYGPMNLMGGVLQLVNNGRGGKGIRADSTLVIGNPGAEGPVLSVKTTGMIAGEQEGMFPPGGMGFPMPDFGDTAAWKNFPMPEFGDSAVWKNFPQGGFPDFQPGEGFPDFQPGEGGFPFPPDFQPGEGGFPFFPDSLRGNGGFPPMGEWDGDGFPMGFPGMGERFVNKKPKAIRAAGDITIYSGTITISCDCDGGEGIESKQTLVIEDGDIRIDTYDDCLSAAKQIVINGGSVYCRSSRNDAIDSNGRASGAITINGGSIWALSEAGPPEEGLDTDFADIVIAGGMVFSMGGSMGGRPAGPSETTALQPTCLLLNLPLTEGDVFSVTSEKGKTLFEFQAPFSMRMNSTVCSLPEFARDKTYYIKVNDETKRTLVFTSQCLVSSK